MATNKKISELPAATLPVVAGAKFEALQGGINVQVDAADMPGSAAGVTSVNGQTGVVVLDLVTREFNRAFSETLVFDKNEIFHTPTVQTGPINLTIAPGGLVDQGSVLRFRMTMNGIDPMNFGPGFDFLNGITNGQILAAGTYSFWFVYTNGSVEVSTSGVTSEESTAVVLAIPENFAAVADGETAIDLSWDDVSGESSYLIEVSSTGTSGWATQSSPAAGATTATQTGLSAGDTRFYRIKSIGDGVATLDSGFSSVVSAQTEDLGDVADPVPTFLPASGVTTWPINKPITITLNEPITNTNGTDIVSDQAGIIILKETNSGGADIGQTWTIDGTKTIITIYADTHYGELQLVFVAINNIEDVNGNDVTVAISSTFTTTDFTFFNIDLHNRIQFGDILDTLWPVNDVNFWLELTVQNPAVAGTRPLVTKYNTVANQRSFQWYYIGTDIYFGWVGAVTGAHNRVIKWTGVFGDGVWVLKYDGSIDTNDGLDRVVLLKDAVIQGSKTLFTTNGLLQSIANSTAQLAVGGFVNVTGDAVSTSFYADEAKDFIVRSNAGATVEMNVPNLVEGLDTSGNARHGTWVTI